MYKLDQDETNIAFERFTPGRTEALSLNFAIANNASESNPCLPELQCALFMDEVYDANGRWWLVVRIIQREDIDELMLLTRPLATSDVDSDDGATAYLIDLPENDYLQEYREAAHAPTLDFYKACSWSDSSEEIAWSEHEGNLPIPDLVFTCSMDLLKVSDVFVNWDAEKQLYTYTTIAVEYIETIFGSAEQAFCSAEFDENFLDDILRVSECPVSHFF